MRKKTIFTFLLAILLCIGIGYAYLTQNLAINGTLGLAKNTWNVHFTNVSAEDGVIPTVHPTISSDGTSLSFSASFNNLDDYYYFQVGVINEGSIDAMVDDISFSLTEANHKTFSNDFIQYECKYISGESIDSNNLLRSGEHDIIYVSVWINDDLDESDLPSEDLTLEFNLDLSYSQANSSAVEIDHHYDEFMCSVVSGTGTQIGDEIKCGTENFYVMSDDDYVVELMSKYNLNVGANVDKFYTNIDHAYKREKCWDSSCTSIRNSTYIIDGISYNYENDFDEALSEYINNSTYLQKSSDGEEIYEEDGVYYIKKSYKFYYIDDITSADSGYGIQNELALGVTGEKGNANYPMRGVLFLLDDIHNYGHVSHEIYFRDIISYQGELYEDGYVDIEFLDDYFVTDILSNYTNYLENYNVSYVDLPTVKDINQLYSDIYDDDLPLSDWYYDGELIDTDDDGDFTHNADLKLYFSDTYKWLWNSSYWTRTINERLGEYNGVIQGDTRDDISVYFVTSSGDFCSEVNSTCHNPIPRAGIRPIIWLPKSSIDYIKPQND